MILITGGAGVMGRRLVRKFTAAGKRVRVLTLPGDAEALKLQAEGIEVVFGDVTKRDTLDGIAEGAETVFHLAAVILSPVKPELFDVVNYHGTANVLAECERAGVRHFIYISSASVVYDNPNPYSLSKRRAEELVKASTIKYFTVVRPTLAYESGGAEEFIHFVNYLKKFPIVPFIGNGKSLKSPVYVEDLVDGFTAIAGNEKSYGKTYNFSGGSVHTMNEMAKMILGHLGIKKPFVHLPVVLCRMLAVVAMVYAKIFNVKPLLTWQTISGVTQNADLDNTSAREDLGYNPKTFPEGLKNV
ncbi:MAG: NAD-dependent epimerase/dehydratase family protein [Fibrobacteres bacterium]|nr:NAD-dependent epimerase/dehydratase family protein [Fibrobacterota bacterium]